MRILLLTLFISIVSLNLSACGKKGPLTLPDENQNPTQQSN